MALTTFFGATSATKTAAKVMHYEVSTMHDTLRHMLVVLNQIRDRL